MGEAPLSANFGFLAQHDQRLAVLAAVAEAPFRVDPLATLMRLRQLSEALASEAAARTGIYLSEREDQMDRLRRLTEARVLSRELADVFHALRKLGNRAVHQGEGDASAALHALKLAREVSVWFHRSFGGEPGWKPGPFVPPVPPADVSASLQREIEELKKRVAESQAASEAARTEAEEARRRALSAAERAAEDQKENEALEALLDEAGKREAEMVERLKAIQARATQAPAETEKLIARAEAASQKLELDEASTRALIDEQLRQAGWEADTGELSWSKGARPIKNRYLAIAEWPTDTGPADYVLFVGLEALAVVEAKRMALRGELVD